MSKSLRIKDEFKNQVIGFNHSAVPLGQRNDIHLLYDLAVAKKLDYLLQLFEEVTEEKSQEVAKERADAFIAKHEKTISEPKPVINTESSTDQYKPKIANKTITGNQGNQVNQVNQGQKRR